jgi:hypothetical protein
VATGRIGVTPVLRTRWSDQPTTGTTVLSGLDDNSVALVYDAGYEAVYRNGVLLSRGNDYTATDGTTITLIDATLAGDIIEVFANDLVPLTDAISKGQYNAKGALLSASAAATPAVLPVGTNGQILTAASGQTTGLQWVTPAASGSMTLLSTTTLSGGITTVSSISGAYKDLLIHVSGMSVAAQSYSVYFVPDSNGSISSGATVKSLSTTASTEGFDSNVLWVNQTGDYRANNTNNAFTIRVFNYASSDKVKNYSAIMQYVNGSNQIQTQNTGGGLLITSAITSWRVQTDISSFNGGTMKIYGVN